MDSLWIYGVFILALLQRLACGQPYTVNVVPLTGCSEKVTLEKIGDSTFPCIGYLNLNVGTDEFPDNRRMCTTGGSVTLFHKEAAQRFCHDTGINTYREGDLEVRLFECDAYFGEDVEVPDTTSGTRPVAGIVDGIYGGVLGNRCHKSLSTEDSACYEDCYLGDQGPEITGTSDPPIGTAEVIPDDVTITHHPDQETNCLTYGGPFFAVTCHDIDECKVGKKVNCSTGPEATCDTLPACGAHATCANLPGSFTCICDDGYEEVDAYNSEIGCIDINECETADICGFNAQCRNLGGSYICICDSPDLYDEATNKCTRPTCPDPPNIPNSMQSTQEDPNQYIFTCDDGFSLSDDTTEITLNCSDEGKWIPDPPPVCEPVQCGDIPVFANSQGSGSGYTFGSNRTFNCWTGYRLINQDLGTTSFSITCQSDGTWTDGTDCEDVTECVDDPEICGPGKHCINTPGSHLCSCFPWATENDQCAELATSIDFLMSPCEMTDTFELCQNGECEVTENNTAYCNCTSGFEGVACDKATFDTPMVVSVAAVGVSTAVATGMVVSGVVSYASSLAGVANTVGGAAQAASGAAGAVGGIGGAAGGLRPLGGLARGFRGMRSPFGRVPARGLQPPPNLSRATRFAGNRPDNMFRPRGRGRGFGRGFAPYGF